MSLNFIMEDYSTGMLEDISEVKNNIWNSKYRFKKEYNTISFEPRVEELNGSDELYQIFLQYSNIPCINVKSKYSDDNMDSYDYIRIHINNTWAYVCEKDCYLTKEYYKRLHYAKSLYMQIVKDFSSIDLEKIKMELEDNYKEAERIKLFANNRKMSISWDEYVNKVNMYIDRISVNFKPVDIYEEENPDNDIDFEELIGYTDDNYAVSYINKSLTGYFRNEYLKNMNLPIGKRYQYKECCNCGKLILSEYRKCTKYCSDCASKIKQSQVNKSKRNKRLKSINY